MFVSPLTLLFLLFLGVMTSHGRKPDNETRQAVTAITKPSAQLLRKLGIKSSQILDKMQSVFDRQDAFEKEWTEISRARTALLKQLKENGLKNSGELFMLLRGLETQIQNYKDKVAELFATLQKTISDSIKTKAAILKSYESKLQAMSSKTTRLRGRLGVLKLKYARKLSEQMTAYKNLQKQAQEKTKELDERNKKIEGIQMELNAIKKSLQKETSENSHLQIENAKKEKEIKIYKHNLKRVILFGVNLGKRFNKCQGVAKDLYKRLILKTAVVYKLANSAKVCRNVVEDKTKAVQNLTTIARETQQKLDQCNADRTEAREALKKAQEVDKMRLEALARLSNLIKLEELKMKQQQEELESMRKKTIGLGDHCGEANSVCIDGLACSKSRICVPVCNDVLAPDVVNAHVAWTKHGEAYEGVITCNDLSTYVGQPGDRKLLCQPSTGHWNTETEGNCVKSHWIKSEIVDNIQYDIPDRPKTGWSACIAGKTLDNKTTRSNITLTLTDTNGRPLIHILFRSRELGIGRGRRSAEVAPKPDASQKRIVDQNDPKPLETVVEVPFAGRTLMTLTLVNQDTLQPRVNGVPLSNITIPDFKEGAFSELAAHLLIKGDFEAIDVDLWCEDATQFHFNYLVGRIKYRNQS